MYQHYFGLTEAPFSIAPDPRYLYMSDKHREALAHLIYGVGDQGGFVLLTGEVGTGKTTVCRCLLQQVPDNVDVAFIIHPKLSSNQLLQSIYQELDIPQQQGMTTLELVDGLNRYLLDAHSRGRNTILIIDEAQNLPVDILEQLRLLTNLETNEKKLLQLVLIGQPELNEVLDKPELRQLAQRVTARYHLEPLSRSEVTDYIRHRLAVAGCRQEVFPAASIRQIYQLTQGIPRLINLLCGRVLMGIYATNGQQATRAIIRRAAREVFPSRKYRRWPSLLRPALSAVIVLLVVALATVWWSQYDAQPSTADNTANSAVTATTLPGWQGLLKQDSHALALQALYQDWQIQQSLCDRGEQSAQGVYCYQQTIDAAQLQAMNSPAVIELVLANGDVRSVYVRGLRGEQIELLVSGQRFTLPLTELTALHWQRVSWLSRIPPSMKLPLQPMQSADDAAALQQWLSQLPLAPATGLQDIRQQDQQFSYLYRQLLPLQQTDFATRWQQLQQALTLPANDPLTVSTLQRISHYLTADPALSTDTESQG